MTGKAHREDSHPAWWNPWHWPTGIWVLVIGLLLLMLPFGIRTVMLAGVPSMAEPFDVDEFVKWDVPAEQDAFTEYEEASDLRPWIVVGGAKCRMADPKNVDAVLEQGWGAADEPIREWLEKHQTALAVWRRGTDKNSGLNHSPDCFESVSRSIVRQSQETFVRLALLEAARCIHDGKLDDGWHWVRAAHRCGGHSGPWLYVNMRIHWMSAAGMSRWAEHPALTSRQLMSALADLRSDYSLYESESSQLKLTYLFARKEYSNPEWVEPIPNAPPVFDRATRMGYWMMGEPELTLRLLRQVLANQLREVDKPVVARRPQVGGRIALLFDPDPAVPLLPGQLDPAGIDRGILRSSLSRRWFVDNAIYWLDRWLLRQAARQATIEVVLAAQAYRRDHGEFPDSLQQLVPDYLASVPADPCDPLGGPVLYRRDEVLQAVVWSVGDDGIDGGGDVESLTNQSSDVGFVLK